MKWFSEWWGIQLVAESESEVKLLKELNDKLDDKASTAYEDGIKKESNDLMYSDTDIKPKYILEFER